MKLKRLWLEDIKYGLVYFEDRHYPQFLRFIEQRFTNVFGPLFCTVGLFDVHELEEGGKMQAFSLVEDSSRLATIREKQLTIFSNQMFEPPSYSLHEKDVYYFNVRASKLSALGCNREVRYQLETRYQNNQGTTVLHQGELFFCNFSPKPTWSINHPLLKHLEDNVWQLLLGRYDHQSPLFNLDQQIFRVILSWLVALESTYEEI